MSDAQVVLDLRSASVRFGSSTVLRDVDLQIQRGEVVGLLGQNGSGKSTLIKLLAGINRPEPGTTLMVGDEHIDLPLSPTDIQGLNMAFVHQDLGLAEELTVAENLIVAGAEADHRFIPWPAERRRLREMLASYGINIDPSSRVGALQPVERALIAIVRAVESIKQQQQVSGTDHAIIFLDEPTVFLPKEETEFLYTLVRKLARDGASTMFISHDLAAVRELCNRVVILRDGRLTGEAMLDQVDDDELVELIVGKRVDGTARARPEAKASLGAPIVQATGIAGRRIDGIDLHVQPGEILGVAGLAGSGADELPYALFGAERCDAGAVTIDGVQLSCVRNDPLKSMRAGLGLVPADRRREAIAPELDLTANAMLLALGKFRWFGLLDWLGMRRHTRGLIDTFDVRPRDENRKIGLLSGGNQQKVVLAKWLEIRPKALILHEPTQGVDVAARADIRTQVAAAATRGMGVIWVTTDFEELESVSDRVLVVANGRIAEELVGDDIAEANINLAVYRSSTGAHLNTSAPEQVLELADRSNHD
ncbi:MAG: sugar ABC transporter ATP-binding protein [Galactobacter sp.]